MQHSILLDSAPALVPSGLPARDATPTSDVVARVRRHLSAHVSGRPTARSPWAFYEELDAWLGPWGEAGYPLGYGRFYAHAFTTHRRLLRNATARRWVFRTASALQEALLEFVCERMVDGTLPELTEPELRRAAFASHAAAYDRAGLARVMVLAPELLPVITLLPLAEFDPRSENFVPSVDQALEVARRVVPKAGFLAAWTAWRLPMATFCATTRALRAGCGSA